MMGAMSFISEPHRGQSMGITLVDDNIQQIFELVASLPPIRTVHLLPYHNFGKNKHHYSGRSCPAEEAQPPGRPQQPIARFRNPLGENVVFFLGDIGMGLVQEFKSFTESRRVIGPFVHHAAPVSRTVLDHPTCCVSVMIPTARAMEHTYIFIGFPLYFRRAILLLKSEHQ